MEENKKTTENQSMTDRQTEFDKRKSEPSEDNAGQKNCSCKTTVKKLCNRWFIEAFTGMAQGLFVTLIAGTILKQIGIIIGDNVVGNMLVLIGKIAQILMGAGIGAGIAHKLNAKSLVIFTAAVTGFIGAWALPIMSGTLFATTPVTLENGDKTVLTYFNTIYLKALPGNPIGSYIVALLTIEVAQLYAGKTKLDIVLVPLGMLILSIGGIYLAWPFIKFIDLIAQLLVIMIEAGEAVKIIVGILVAVIMGILLTMPTSSAAIWVSIVKSDVAIAHPEVFLIAGGAATAGCCAHMVGFAVASFRENRWGGLVAQGLGTSMLQIPNIMKKPIIMLPMVIASAIGGFSATWVFGLKGTDAGGGMGTAGLVGVFESVTATSGTVSTFTLITGVALVYFILPALISFAFAELFRKKGIIKSGDYALKFDK